MFNSVDSRTKRKSKTLCGKRLPPQVPASQSCIDIPALNSVFVVGELKTDGNQVVTNFIHRGNNNSCCSERFSVTPEEAREMEVCPCFREYEYNQEAVCRVAEANFSTNLGLDRPPEKLSERYNMAELENQILVTQDFVCVVSFHLMAQSTKDGFSRNNTCDQQNSRSKEPVISVVSGVSGG